MANEEKKREIRDTLLRLSGKKTAADLARERYIAYLIEPSAYNRDRLREAYEDVPEHERMYLGDMDTKDSDYWRILYSEEKREV